LSAIPPVTVVDADARSADPVTQNLAALKALFPDAFSEGRIDFEVLKQLLGGAVDDGDEKYGLNWSGKRQARRLALTPSMGTLLPAPNDSEGWNATRNLMIEGENLEVLKLLQKSYAGEIKLIYIDPPYNKGKDFVYPDDYSDSLGNYMRRTGQVGDEGVRNTSNPESSGRFHTDWLNMMYPRLMLSRNLLTSDGIFLVSIDDAEVSNLRELLDNVFGEENFISCLTWDKSRKNDAKFFSNGHEYMLVYAKSVGFLREKNTVWRQGKPGTRDIWLKYLELRQLHGRDDLSIEADLQEWFRSLPKSDPAKKWSRYKRVDKFGPWRDRDISWPGGGGETYDVIHPRTGKPCKVPEAGWRYSSPEEMQRQIKLGTVEFRDDESEPPFRKHHLRPVRADLPDDEENDLDDGGEDDELATQVRGSYIYKQSQVAVKDLKSLMGPNVFNNPKDREELTSIFNYVMGSDSEYITLDFFAGSGTTGHSVMAQNVADNGNRRFILVQLPEPLDPAKKDQKTASKFCDSIGKPRNIAELTKERLRRAAAKIKAETPEAATDLGFRVYKLATSNLKAWVPGDDLEADLLSAADNLAVGRTEDDLLVELLLKQGIDLTEPAVTKTIAGRAVHAFGGGVLVVCLGEVTASDAEALADGIAGWVAKLGPAAPTTVFFKDVGFENDQAKTNVDAILRQRLGDQLLKVRSV
jgi:adenine-specific DNA-methyltransferase